MSEELGAAGLRFEREGAVAWCVIDRPHARNAFTPAMYFGIKRAVGIVNADPELAALIITGAGDVFAPGGDLGGRSDPGDEPTPDIGHDILPFLTIRDSRAPVVAAVNGICQAGGLLIAMLADIAVASDRATFRVPELLLSARRFDAVEAHRIGVVSRLVPHEQLRDAALLAVREILQTPPMARMHVKRMLNERYGLIDYQTMFWALAESPEPREGMLAFMEKRAPSWVPEEFA